MATEEGSADTLTERHSMDILGHPDSVDTTHGVGLALAVQQRIDLAASIHR